MVALIKKITWNLVWGLILGLGYSLIIMESRKLYAQVRLDEYGFNFALSIIAEFILLGFFTGLIASFASKPFKLSKVIFCVLIGTIGSYICLRFFSFDSWRPFFVLALFMSITVGIIDKSLSKQVFSIIYFIIVFIVAGSPLPQIRDSASSWWNIRCSSLPIGVLIVLGMGIGEFLEIKNEKTFKK